ncbi:PBSX family phage terminase large subunit [Lysinibacillus sp. FSL K6-0075]|uniref:PBSX family phage terminase large subunit n=1 Tax=Lysinibacillus sp. FSL K6-0075 TaxID=2921415 RepID=UPI00315902E8
MIKRSTHIANRRSFKLIVDEDIFNEIYLKVLSSTCYMNLLYGGGGSGKSSFMRQKVVLMAMAKKERIVIFRKVASTLRDSVFAEVMEQLDEFGISSLVKVNRTRLEVVFPNGSVILFKGLDDPEKVKGLMKTTKIWIEEASELKEADLNQLETRLRGDHCDDFQIFMTFNPISEHHWLKKKFFDKEQEDTLIVHSTYLDNKFIDNKFHKKMLKIKERDPNHYNIYALGHWGSLGKMVYKNYKVIKATKDYSFFDYLVCGLDFGSTDPNAFLVLGVKGEDIYVLHELVINDITNNVLIELIKDKFPFVLREQIPIVADCAAKGYITEFVLAGFNIHPTIKGPHSKKEGIDHVKRRMIYIDESCETTYAEICSYEYMQNKNGEVLENPKDGNDHCMDSLRYAVYEYVKIFNLVISDYLMPPSHIKRGRGSW